MNVSSVLRAGDVDERGISSLKTGNCRFGGNLIKIESRKCLSRHHHRSFGERRSN